jgi:hypothetical protein
MRSLVLALLCIAIVRPMSAQDADEKAALEKEFPIILEIEKSSIVNVEADHPERLSQAAAMGAAPPIFGVFTGMLNREHHWKFGCWTENMRYGRIPCVDMPIGLHRARWLHNRELLEVFAYDSAGNVTLRYLDVAIDPKDPPPPDDLVQNLPTFSGFFAIDQTKRDYPLLVHVYGAVSLSFQAGELPARTNCDITAPFPNRANVNCTQYPPIPIYQGNVQVEASIDGHLPHGNLSCDAKWRWSKCAVIEPGFYAARWKDSGHTQIVLLGERVGKPEETGFEVH